MGTISNFTRKIRPVFGKSSRNFLDDSVRQRIIYINLDNLAERLYAGRLGEVSSRVRSGGRLAQTRTRQTDRARFSPPD